MPSEKVVVGQTCGHNKTLWTRDCKDEADFTSQVRKATRTLCDECLRAIGTNQSDKGAWK